MINQKVDVTELDFDEIKDNLKVFLKNQNQFKDYDFEGSGMSVLLDTLAYNTHYLGFNANMLANEMFLDSAALRSSIVSHAKTLGYEVSSCGAPMAKISTSLSTTDATKVMPAGTKFTTTVDGTNYQFVTASSYSAANAGNSITFDEVEIYEGSYVTTRYTVDNSNPDQRFLLTDNRADTSTITVQVQNSASDTILVTYTKATDISQLTKNATVYFLQEIEQGKFEIYFGDGVVSKKVQDGNIIILKYVVTNKTAANGANLFTAPASIDGVTGITLTLVAAASGGSEPETLDSIKLSAPLDYAAQGRCVTRSDYQVFAKKLFANTQSVSVWGGEDGSYDTSLGVVSTPQFGKVFISIKTNTGQNLTAAQKSSLVTSFSPFTVASITPVIVDPETLSLILNCTFMYDSTTLAGTKPDLEAAVLSRLTTFNDDELKSFNKPYRSSYVQGLLDDVNPSILNNTTSVVLSKKLKPQLGTIISYTISYSNPLSNPHDGHLGATGGIVASTGFKINGNSTQVVYFDDDGKGNLRTYYLTGAIRTYINSTAGVITYSEGKISINSINITAVENVDNVVSDSIRITVKPASQDIVPVRNQVLEIDLVNTVILGSVDSAAITGLGYTTNTTGTSATTTINTTSSTTTTSAY